MISKRFIPTRRFYRRIFRQMRLYLPLLTILLLSMALFLPISAGWLARRAEKEAAERLGLDVEVDALRVTVAEGWVQAYGIRLPGEGDAPPFEVGRAELEGTLRGLLAGGESWPDRVVVDGLPPLDVKREEGRYQIRGAFETLATAIATVRNRPVNGASNGKQRAQSQSVGRTPEVILRNLPVRLESPGQGIPDVRIHIDSVELRERQTRNSPVYLNIKGVATANTAETFNLEGNYLPDQERVVLDGNLSGLTIPFVIPGLDRFQGKIQNLDVKLEANLEESGEVVGLLTVNAGQFEVRRDRLGGERWADEPLTIRLQFRYDLLKSDLVVDQLSLYGRQVDIALSGKAHVGDDFPGEATLLVQRLPPAALALGRNELVDRLGVVVEESGTTTTTLRLEARASGAFARPAELEANANLKLDGWLVRSPMLPDSVNVQRLDASISRSETNLTELRFEFGGLSVMASGKMPLEPQAADEQPGWVNLRLDGDAERAFDLLLRLGALPREIRHFSAPISAEARIPIRFEEDGPRPLLDDINAVCSWRAGSASVRTFNSPIQLESGELRYDRGQLSIPRIILGMDDLFLNLSGDAELRPTQLQPENISADLAIVAGGSIDGLLQVVRRFVTLPDMPRDLRGNVRAELNVAGSGADLENLDYSGRLLLEDGAVTIDIPYSEIPLEGISSEIQINKDSVRISRLAVKLNDPEIGESTAEITATVTPEEVRADVRAFTHLEQLPKILRKDLRDVYMEGPLPAEGWFTLKPSGSLPGGPDTIRRWVTLLKKSDLKVGIKPTDDLIADFEVASRQTTPVSVFVRDFPVAVENIRGNARIVPGMLEIRDALFDAGSAKDVSVDFFQLRFGRPVYIDFKGSMDYLNVNEWLSGWGSQPWAPAPVSLTPRWRNFAEPYQFVEVAGTMDVGEVDFLQYKGSNASTRLVFEGWSRTPGRLRLEDLGADVYGGWSRANVDMTFPRNERPILNVRATMGNVDVDPFLDALRETDQKLDGLLTGELNFSGQLLNYPTYAGTGEFEMKKSSVVGSIILVYAEDLLKSLTGEQGKVSEISGKCWMADEEIHFTELTIAHPNATFATEGYIDFRGRLYFDVVASVIGRTISGVPLVGDVVKLVGDNLLVYRVRGKLGEPTYTPIPSLLPRLERLRGILQNRQPPAEMGSEGFE